MNEREMKNKKLFDPSDLSCERWNASSDEDRKRIDWHRDWDSLKDIEREFLLLIYPELPEFDKLKAKPIQRLLNSAMSRAIERNYIEKSVCSRCNGGGHYSWNRVDGSMCYGCYGTGITRPRVTKKLIKEV